MATMLLNVSTRMNGSSVDTDLGISPEEWAKLSDDEQQELMNEAIFDLIDCWVSEAN